MTIIDYTYLSVKYLDNKYKKIEFITFQII